ncbi:hypothetical protein DYU11_32145 [Fibrisoma montanum]|uniref:Uncharacterized protein n=1 Tax=Fibrisoma montanum TaxID=2305895 RepID=A0A418LWB9_9BACT|nr:hypothetical protein DYU11_32145 [Fibrisoma montanum]
MMLETAAYLGTSLFFGLLVLFSYRNYKKSNQPIQKPITVPLRTDRTSLLEGQRKAVADRRNRLKSEPESKPPERVKPPEETRPAPASEEPIESGFGEDLGSALTLDKNSTTTETVKRSRSAGQSRFAALQDAADQFKDIYNRNSQL